MKAWQIHELGEPKESLTLEEINAPEPMSGQLLIEVEAVGLAFPDVLQCRGEYQVKPPLPFIPGGETSGTVIAVGEEVEDFSVGQKVIALGGGLAGIGAALLILQYDVHPTIGISFGPLTFMICVLGGLGNMIGGFIAAFVMSQLISLGGFFLDTEWGYVIAFVFFIIMMFIRPQGLFGNRS